MNLYLDDERGLPDGFDRKVTTAAAAIALLEAGGVTRLSLDHDLGPPEAGTGYDVAQWLEKAAWLWSREEAGGVGPLTVGCHSANPVGAANINWALSRAMSFWGIGERRRAGTLPEPKKAGPKVKPGAYTPTGNEWQEWAD